MPRFIITTKQMKNANGIRIEPGMSVEVVTQSMSNPVLANGGQPVVDAFMRIYGIDIRRAGALNMTYLNVERTGKNFQLTFFRKIKFNILILTLIFVGNLH